MKKIITIQSSVLSGLVGNQAASLVLGNLGYQVFQIPTTILSSHKGDKGFIEIPIKNNTPNIFYQSLKKSLKISNNDIFLVGYIPNIQIGNSVLKVIKNKRKIVLDPVMGDIDTGAYVSKQVIDFLPKVISVATHVSMNFFEWSILIGKDISNYKLKDISIDVRQYCKKNNQIILIRSIIKKNKLINIIASKNDCYYIETPNIKFKKRIDGAGDISTSLFTHYIFLGISLSKVLELVTNRMFLIIQGVKNREIIQENLIKEFKKGKFRSKSSDNL